METHARYVIVGLFTILAVAAGFAFVFWLHTTGGVVAKQAAYRVRFDAPVIGLRPGVSVLFNGMRVGEVQTVQLDPANPGILLASLAVDPTTPVGEDTRVGVETAGLLGSINVSLTGGASHTTPKSGPDGAPPLLIADPAATASLGEAAKATLNKVDAILNDNATPIHNAIANLSTFTDALAKNSGRVDNILAGLEKMTGGGTPPTPPPFYDLNAPSFASTDKPQNAQIAVADPTALVMFETQRALISPKPGERRPIEGGQWSDSLPILVRAKIVQTLENAGFTRVAGAHEGFSADIQALVDIRAFEITLEPAPSAHVAFAVKLLSGEGKIIGAEIFEASSPAAGVGAADAFAALNDAFAKAAHDFGLWMEKTI